jgi:acetyl-CoA acyltransferase
MARHNLDWSDLDEVIFCCANQAGEDNRNVARMSALLAGLPDTVPGTTMNRLCGSGMDAVVKAARAVRAEELDFIIAGGVNSMSGAPFVMPKAVILWSKWTNIRVRKRLLKASPNSKPS